MKEKLLIGFIGQGFIGKNYADDFEKRGYEVVRYAKEEPYFDNKDRIKDCDFVFIAVPTPTTPHGFNFDILKSVLSLIGAGKTAIIKSTILPGTCEALQKMFPEISVFHSPEFLTEKNAAYDAANPTRNIIGILEDNKENRAKAEEVLAILPSSPLNLICLAKEAELIKYASNGFLFLKIVYANILYDLAMKEGSEWEIIKNGMAADPRRGKSHLDPVQASSSDKKPGRGAGGHCFVKDFSALIEYVNKLQPDSLSHNFLKSAQDKNLELLTSSAKDPEVLKEVFGLEI